MQTIGKPESVQPSLAFYFTDAPSTRTLVKVGLSNLAIDIPPGTENHLVEDSYEMPVDAELLAILPHAHYLGKELQGLATLPDGTKKEFLLIKHWDFNWQNDYRLAKPLFLPKGSTLTMNYTFDNSTNNVRNPNNPPKRVRYGAQTTDEMAELWIQLQLRTKSDLPIMEKALFVKVQKKSMAYNEYRLRLNPNDAEAHARLGEGLFSMDKKAEAADHFRAAIEFDPNYDVPHYYLGLIHRTQNQLGQARQEFETVLRLNPQNSKAHGNLGFIFASLGNVEEAESHLRAALELNPNDTLVSKTLADVLRAKKGNNK
jgi:tetratricopeptide (TPR) repeat protein